METTQNDLDHYKRVSKWLHDILSVEHESGNERLHGEPVHNTSGAVSARRKHTIQQSNNNAISEEG
jgi:hypothetical protein